jgi:hypothetical protein
MKYIKKNNVMEKIRFYSFLFFLAIVNYSLQGCEPKKSASEPLPDEGFSGNFESLFDGQSLSGWEGDSLIWTVEDGNIIGRIKEGQTLNANTFLIWKGGQPSDFELKLDFKISREGNSGVNYRSEPVPDVPYALRGYQADMDGLIRYTGQNYEERKRTTLAYRGQQTKINPQDPPGDLREYVEKNAWKGLEVTSELGDRDELGQQILSEDWNSMHLIIKGNLLQHYVNGILMSEVLDEDSINRRNEGLLGFQVHVGPPMIVMFRNIELKNL